MAGKAEEFVATPIQQIWPVNTEQQLRSLVHELVHKRSEPHTAPHTATHAHELVHTRGVHRRTHKPARPFKKQKPVMYMANKPVMYTATLEASHQLDA